MPGSYGDRAVHVWMQGGTPPQRVLKAALCRRPILERDHVSPIAQFPLAAVTYVVRVAPGQAGRPVTLRARTALRCNLPNYVRTFNRVTR